MLFRSEGGKNVYPEEIEDAFQLYYDVEQIMVRGYVANKTTKSEQIEALIYPSDDLIKRLGVSRDDILGNFKVCDEMKIIVDKVNRTLQPYARISKITILNEPLEMTTTRKIKRGNVGKNPQKSDDSLAIKDVAEKSQVTAKKSEKSEKVAIKKTIEKKSAKAKKSVAIKNSAKKESSQKKEDEIAINTKNIASTKRNSKIKLQIDTKKDEKNEELAMKKTTARKSQNATKKDEKVAIKKPASKKSASVKNSLAIKNSAKKESSQKKEDEIAIKTKNIASVKQKTAKKSQDNAAEKKTRK